MSIFFPVSFDFKKHIDTYTNGQQQSLTQRMQTSAAAAAAASSARPRALGLTAASSSSSSSSALGGKKVEEKVEHPGLSQEEVDELQEAFNLFDTTNSGELERRRYCPMTRSLLLRSLLA